MHSLQKETVIISCSLMMALELLPPLNLQPSDIYSSHSLSVFTHTACTQTKTSEIHISPAVFMPFGSNQYQDHVLIFFIL